MANGTIQIPPDSTGKKIDAASLDVGADSVIRQRIVIGDNSATANFAIVNASGALNVTGAVNISGTAIVAFNNPPVINNISATVTISGNVNISQTATISGNVNISATANVVIGVGTSNIGGVSLVAGTSNIGFINSISRTVDVAITTPFTVNNISATVNTVIGAGTSNIGYINHISQTLIATLAQSTANIGGVSIVAGTSNIGFINHISATVNVSFAGGISLVAGTANIGSINSISRTVDTATRISGFSDPSGDTRNVVDSSNLALRVNVVAGAAGGVSMNDGASYTATSAFVPMGGTFDDVAPATVGEGLAGAARITTNRAFHVNNRTDGGVAMDDSTNSALRVNVVAGAAGGVSLNDNASFTATSAFVPIGGVFNDVATTTVTEDRAGAARITTNRAIHVNLRDNAGGEISSGNALSVKVERISATASVILAAGAANIGTINDISKTVNTVIGAGTSLIGGVSLVAGTANIGFIDHISATVNVAFAGGISLAAGTANIGFINNISATVIVAGTLSLASGTANIGSVNSISRTVDVVGSVFLTTGTANIGTLNDISRTVNTVVGAGTALMGAVSIAAGTSNIGFINNISATVIVAGTLSLAAGTANIGSINSISRTINIVCATPFTLDNISQTVVVTTANPYLLNIATASHGPKMVQISTSATATLIAAPGAGLHIYVTQLAVSNAGTVLTHSQTGWSGSVGLITMVAAANGGGFVLQFDPPWKVESNGPVNCRVKPNSLGNCYFNINFFVAA